MRNHQTKWFPLLYKVIGFMFMLTCSGCFVPRFSAPLEDTELPDYPVAILPVTPGQISMPLKAPETSDPHKAFYAENIIKDREEVAKAVNVVLNSLAEGPNNPLLGPEKLKARINDATFWEKVYVYLNDPGNIAESWKLQGLSELSKDLEVENIVIILATVDIDPQSYSDNSWNWKGKIIIKADLLSLTPSSVLASGKGEAGFWGSIGAIGGGRAAVPYAMGKTFGRAVDQALRAALKETFSKKEK